MRRRHRPIDAPETDGRRDLILSRRIEEVQKGWSAKTRFLRAHGITGERVDVDKIRARTNRVEMPVFRGFRPHRKAARSVVGAGYDQHDIYFEYVVYLMDHQ